MNETIFEKYMKNETLTHLGVFLVREGQHGIKNGLTSKPVFEN